MGMISNKLSWAWHCQYSWVLMSIHGHSLALISIHEHSIALVTTFERSWVLKSAHKGSWAFISRGLWCNECSWALESGHVTMAPYSWVLLSVHKCSWALMSDQALDSTIYVDLFLVVFCKYVGWYFIIQLKNGCFSNLYRKGYWKMSTMEAKKFTKKYMKQFLWTL